MTPEFHYCSVIGKWNFLEKSTRPDISGSIHQCARFSERPKCSHAEAVKQIGCYLLATKDKGLLIRPNYRRYFKCWVDADFSGNWQQRDTHNDLSPAQVGLFILPGHRSHGPKRYRQSRHYLPWKVSASPYPRV